MLLRWLFHLVAGLSLLLMLTCCLAWIRSAFGACDILWRIHADREYVIGHSSGKLELGYVVYESSIDDVPFWEWNPGRNYGMDVEWDLSLATRETHFAGFDYYRQPEKKPNGPTPMPWVNELILIRVPLWFAVLFFSVLPLLWVRASMRRRLIRIRLERGWCTRCGYDLQGSAGACPECGTTMEKMHSTSQATRLS